MKAYRVTLSQGADLERLDAAIGVAENFGASIGGGDKEFVIESLDYTLALLIALILAGGKLEEAK